MSTNQPFNLSEPGDLNKDGRTDSTFTPAFDADGDGTTESVAGDVNLDGRIDSTYSDLDGDGYQETSLLDTNLDGTLDTVWVDLDGDLMPDMVEALPTGGPFAVADPTMTVGLDACDPEAVFDPTSGAFDTTGLETPGITFTDPFAYDPTVVDSGYADPFAVTYTDAYADAGSGFTSEMAPAMDTSGFADASWDAWNASNSYDSASWDAWSAGDYDTSQVMTDISGDWADYSASMDYLQYDPTDSYSWDAAYDAASQAEWDNWNASVDAYVAGDSEAAYNYNSASIDAASVADSTWDASSSYTSSYDAGTDAGY